MRKNLVLIIGIALLAFTVVGYFGNFVQWSDAEQTTATILNAEQQLVRRGAGHINLDIQYSVDGKPRNGTAQVAASRLQEATPEGELEVYYMRKQPDRVIPVSVLKDKQKAIYFTLGAGIILTLIGIVIGLRKNAVP
jgi:hypothetical protein